MIIGLMSIPISARLTRIRLPNQKGSSPFECGETLVIYPIVSFLCSACARSLARLQRWEILNHQDP